MCIVDMSIWSVSTSAYRCLSIRLCSTDVVNVFLNWSLDKCICLLKCSAHTVEKIIIDNFVYFVDEGRHNSAFCSESEFLANSVCYGSTWYGH